MHSRWRHPPKTVSPRPYCRSRKGRNELGSETKSSIAVFCEKKSVVTLTNEISPFAESVKFLIDNLVPVFHFKMANHYSLS